MAALGQKFIKYDSEFRIAVVLECIEAKEKVRTIAEKHDVNRNTVESWMRSYQKGKLNSKSGRPPVDKEDSLEYWKTKCMLMEKSFASVKLPLKPRLKLSRNLKKASQ